MSNLEGTLIKFNKVTAQKLEAKIMVGKDDLNEARDLEGKATGEHKESANDIMKDEEENPIDQADGSKGE